MDNIGQYNFAWPKPRQYCDLNNTIWSAILLAFLFPPPPLVHSDQLIVLAHHELSERLLGLQHSHLDVRGTGTGAVCVQIAEDEGEDHAKDWDRETGNVITHVGTRTCMVKATLAREQ